MQDFDAVNFATDKIPSGSNIPLKCIYSVPAQEAAKHRAKSRCPPVSNIAAIIKARRETR